MPTYYFIIGLILVVLVWLGHGVWRIGAVSAGATIPENRSAQALILVDLQTVFWDDGPYSEDDKTRAQAAILNEINLAKERGDTIVALRHEWSIPSTKLLARLTMKGQAIAGTSGTEIARPFAGLADHELLKRVQDGFESGELDALFADADVGHVRIVGLDYNFCVQKTALAARNRGYDVRAVTAATLASANTTKAEQRLTDSGVVLQ